MIIIMLETIRMTMAMMIMMTRRMAIMMMMLTMIMTTDHNVAPGPRRNKCAPSARATGASAAH